MMMSAAVPLFIALFAGQADAGPGHGHGDAVSPPPVPEKTGFDGIQIGEPAPAFTLPNLAGETVSLSDHKGKVVVLEWFNPGCPFVKQAHEDGARSSPWP